MTPKINGNLLDESIKKSSSIYPYVRVMTNGIHVLSHDATQQAFVQSNISNVNNRILRRPSRIIIIKKTIRHGGFFSSTVIRERISQIRNSRYTYDSRDKICITRKVISRSIIARWNPPESHGCSSRTLERTPPESGEVWPSKTAKLRTEKLGESKEKDQ